MKKLIPIILGLAVLLTATAGTGIVRAEDQSLEVSVIGGKMIVTVGGDFEDKDWIGIYKEGESVDPNNGGIASLVWWYVNEMPDTVTLPDDANALKHNRLGEFIADGNIVPGTYTVMALANDGYELIDDIDPVTVNVEAPEADLSVDYDASSYEGMEFQQIYWNGNKLNDYAGGESPLSALGKSLDPEGRFSYDAGSGISLGLEGWVGFDQEIVAFGSIVNDDVTWSDAFDLGSDSTIKAEDKGGRFAKRFKVDIDVSQLTGDYTAGVIAALADGTMVKFNSSASPEKNTFISFTCIQPAPVETATPEPTAEPTQLPATAEPTAAPTDAPATENGGATSDHQAATDVHDNGGNDNSGDNNEVPGKKGLGTGAIIGIVCGAVVLAAAIIAGVIIAKKKK